MKNLKKTFTSLNVITVLGFIAMLLSGEIFFKVMHTLTNSAVIAMGMAVVVEGGKYFLTRQTSRTRASFGNLLLYRTLKGLMVSFSVIASMFFFSTFLNDKVGMNQVIQTAQQGVHAEFDRKASILRENLQDLKAKEEAMDQKVKESTLTGRNQWQLLYDRKQAKLAADKERKILTTDLTTLEQERGKKLAEVANPSLYKQDERTRNPQLNSMISTIQGAGFPVGYNGLLFAFCLMIALFLEILIHVTAALKPAERKVAEKKTTSTRTVKPRILKPVA